jgi:crotonobetainyl-CoA:carnitine CoA-transferase CaiB-like acyl-CoA transferase
VTDGGPLGGMKVVDISQQLPGPYCSLLLAGLGAEVVKVEPPQGEAARRIDAPMFEQVNRGKTSLRLDLKSPHGQDELLRLIGGADVFIEGFRPGVTTRLGCSYEQLTAVNPRLVYCSISGFGQSGPWHGRPTHDLSLQAVVGALPPGAVIETVGVPWVDLGVATTAAFLVASHWRAGRAVHLDLAMLDVAAAWAHVKPGAVTDPQPTYGTFSSADGAWFALALLEDDMWQRLCNALDLNAWSLEGGYDEPSQRYAQHDLVRQRLQSEIGRRSRSEIMELAAAHDLPIDEVADAAAASQNEQVVWRQRLYGDAGFLPIGPGVGRVLDPVVES